MYLWGKQRCLQFNLHTFFLSRESMIKCWNYFITFKSQDMGYLVVSYFLSSSVRIWPVTPHSYLSWSVDLQVGVMQSYPFVRRNLTCVAWPCDFIWISFLCYTLFFIVSTTCYDTWLLDLRINQTNQGKILKHAISQLLPETTALKGKRSLTGNGSFPMTS